MPFIECSWETVLNSETLDSINVDLVFFVGFLTSACYFYVELFHRETVIVDFGPIHFLIFARRYDTTGSAKTRIYSMGVL